MMKTLDISISGIVKVYDLELIVNIPSENLDIQINDDSITIKEISNHCCCNNNVVNVNVLSSLFDGNSIINSVIGNGNVFQGNRPFTNQSFTNSSVSIGNGNTTVNGVNYNNNGSSNCFTSLPITNTDFDQINCSGAVALEWYRKDTVSSLSISNNGTFTCNSHMTVESLNINTNGTTTINNIHVTKRYNIYANGMANVRMTKSSSARGSSSVNGMGNITVNNA